MKISILVVAITVTALTALSTAGVFIYKNLNKTPVTIGEVSSSTDAEEKPVAENKEVLKETRLIKDDFEIILPPGWQEATSSPEDVLLMSIDSREDVSAGIFKKLSFRTNFAVKSESRQRYTTISDLTAYVESIRTSLIQAIPGIKFTLEEPKTINGNEAIFVECESTQEEADFKTLLVFVETGDLVVYAISFNTFQEFWPVYQNLFYQIAESFKTRYSI